MIARTVSLASIPLAAALAFAFPAAAADIVPTDVPLPGAQPGEVSVIQSVSA